jgi:hypothetical protein
MYSLLVVYAAETGQSLAETDKKVPTCHLRPSFVSNLQLATPALSGLLANGQFFTYCRFGAIFHPDLAECPIVPSHSLVALEGRRCAPHHSTRSATQGSCACARVYGDCKDTNDCKFDDRGPGSITIEEAYGPEEAILEGCSCSREARYVQAQYWDMLLGTSTAACLWLSSVTFKSDNLND